MRKELALLVLLSTATWAQSPSGLLATNRYIDWSGAGATIATRTTQCGSTISAGASAATIQTAISSCAGSNNYVLLGPGTFTLPSSLVITHAGALNVTLRGSGPTQTFLKFTGTSTNCNGIGAVAVCITNGDGSNVANSSANTLNWTAGYSAGTTTLTAGSAVTGSLANLHVGSLLYLTQADQGSDNGNWWSCGSTGSTGTCSQQGAENQWPARSTSQIVLVTGISGFSVTVSPGLYAPNWSSGRTPYMSFSSSLPISGFGIENMTIDTTSLGAIAAMVEYSWGYNDWIKNVSLINSVNPGGAAHKHVFIGSSSHITVRDSYMYGSSPTMEGYGVDNTIATSDSLIENNICQHIATCMMNESTSGDVYGYNFAVDNFYVGNPAGSAPNWQGSDVSFHDAGNYLNLIEGHEGIQFSEDDIHGTAFANTIFRSYFNGRDPANQCPGGGTGCGTGPKTQDTQAIQLMANNRYVNIVANVLGTSSYFTNYQQQGASGSPSSCPATNWTTLYNLNYGASTLAPFSPACVGSSFIIDNDPLVSSTLMRWGNYDTVNATVRTNAGETGSGAPVYPGLVSPSTSWASYPSFYLTGRPSWFPAGIPWPLCGPDITGGNISNIGGHCNLNPAAACFINTYGGKTDGSTGIISFDADHCYGGGGTPTLGGPNFSPPGGTFLTLPTVTVACTAGAHSCTTTDGTMPTATTPGTCSHGTTDAGNITIGSSGEVLQGLCTEAAYNNSSVTSQTYTQSVIGLSSSGQVDTGTTSVVTASVNLTPNPGDGITCEVSFQSGTTISGVADNVNGSYTQVPTTLHLNTAITAYTGVYYLSGAAGGATTVTLTLNSTQPYVGMMCQSWTPATAGAFTVDSSFTQQQDSLSKTTNPTSGAAASPSNSNELVIGSLLVNNTIPTAGTNFTYLGNAYAAGLAAEYWVQATPTSTNVPFVNVADYWTDQRVGFTFNSAVTAATPTFSPSSGAPPQTVTISTATAGATICYTTNGSTPTASVPGTCDAGSSTYSTPVSVSVNPTTLNAIATKSGDTNSGVGTASYVGVPPVASTPTFSLNSGAILYGSVFTLSTSPDTCTSYIYWSRNSTPPTTGDVNGTGGPVLAAATFYAKVIGCPGYTDSGVGSAAYTIIAPAPSFSPGTGIYPSSQNVLLTSALSGATICYTTDGTTPTANGAGTCTHGSTYSSPVAVTSGSVTIKSISSKSGFTDSAVGSAGYVINPSVPSGFTGTVKCTGTLKIVTNQ